MIFERRPVRLTESIVHGVLENNQCLPVLREGMIKIVYPPLIRSSITTQKSVSHLKHDLEGYNLVLARAIRKSRRYPRSVNLVKR